MEIHEVYSIVADQGGALLIDMDYTGLAARKRASYAYRASDQYSPLTSLITQWLADNPHEILPYVPLVPEPDSVIVIPAVTLWERMTEAEGDQVEATMFTQPFRVRQIFMTAQSYRSDHELWPLLMGAAIELFGITRAAELLAP